MAKNKIGLYTATALVVANMIGTGVFTSLGFETEALPSVPVLLFLWFCGGVVALCGGLSYIALSKLLPGSGGEYHYIKNAYNPLLANAAGLISIVAGFAAPVALAAMAFAAYFHHLVPDSNVKAIAFLLVSVVTLFHCFSIKLGSRFQLLSTGLKLLLILLFICAGIMCLPNYLDFKFGSPEKELLLSPGFFSSLVYVSFAYSGWNASTYIFNDIENPVKNIQRSVIIGTLLVTVLYVLLNLVFLKVLPLHQINGVVEIGSFAATAIFGLEGGKITALIISLLLVSTINAMVWVGPRVIIKMAEQRKIQGFRSSYFTLPLPAILLQYVITVLLLITGTFELILTYTVICLNICSCIAVSILFLRYQTQNLKVLFVAAVFIVANLWGCIFLLFKDLF